MKLVVFCVFAVSCWSLTSTQATVNDKNLVKDKLEEVLRQLSDVKDSLQSSEKMLYTPPLDVEDCCCLTALECFRSNMKVHFTEMSRKQRKLHRSLSDNLTMRGVNFCNSDTVKPTCQACHSHPKENAKEFFNRLESFIQKAKARLSMN